MNYTFQFAQLAPYVDDLIAGTKLTTILAVEAMVLSLIVGIAGAICKNSNYRLLRLVAAVYVDVIRNTPFLVQLFFVFFALPATGLRLTAQSASLLALVLNGGAYLTEIIRAGLNSVPRGQTEAGYALGMKARDIFFFIVLRPAIRAVYPAVTSEFVILLLNTSICSVIAARELTSVGNTINAQTFRSFEVYIILLAIYLGLSFVFSAIFKFGEVAFLKWKA